MEPRIRWGRALRSPSVDAMVPPEHELDRQLRTLAPHAGPLDRLEVVWEGYEHATGSSVERPPTHEQRRDVRDWLRKLRALPDGGPALLKVGRHLTPAVSHSPQEKAEALAQAWCTGCETVMTASGMFPMYVTFSVRVPPWSAQSKRREAPEIRRAVTAGLHERENLTKLLWDGPVCLGIVSLVARKDRTPDVDNLVKGIMDALQGVIYLNDSQVQCVTSRRIDYAGSPGHYRISARAVHPWSADVIFDDPTAPIVHGKPVPVV